jgi:hypothetical protein
MTLNLEAEIKPPCDIQTWTRPRAEVPHVEQHLPKRQFEILKIAEENEKQQLQWLVRDIAAGAA